MKKFLTIMGLLTIVATPLTIVATPASAQSYCSCWGTGNVVDMPALEQQNGGTAFAQAPEINTHQKTRVHSRRSPEAAR